MRRIFHEKHITTKDSFQNSLFIYSDRVFPFTISELGIVKVKVHIKDLNIFKSSVSMWRGIKLSKSLWGIPKNIEKQVSCIHYVISTESN